MDLAREIADLVAQVPRGRVSTFSDIAEALGDPTAAAAVFRILRERRIAGAHRIVRATGEVPWPGAGARLRKEGTAVAERHVADLERARFRDFRGPRTLALLREEQRRLAAHVRRTDRIASWERVAGFDVSYNGDDATAAAVAMDPDGERVLQEVSLEIRIDFPYVPGYLSYREFPAIERCYRRLDPKPDVLLIDGHGVLHPARFGIASYAGVALDTPTIGVAKHLLVGEAGPVPREPGGTTEIRLGGEVLGAGLRSGPSRRLIYVSVGHAISLETAVGITKRLCRTRIPEPLRRADELAGIEKRKTKKKR
jgi:deoxyribonuclease V